jgi:hypothetical protein
MNGEVKPEPHYCLFVRFKDGATGRVRLRPEELTGVLAPLRDEQFFEQVFIDCSVTLISHRMPCMLRLPARPMSCRRRVPLRVAPDRLLVCCTDLMLTISASARQSARAGW